MPLKPNRALAWQLERAMREEQKTKQTMAKQFQTSNPQLDRLLDVRNISVTLDSVTRVVAALGKCVILHDVDMKAGHALYDVRN